jgi:hypothetical protein
MRFALFLFGLAACGEPPVAPREDPAPTTRVDAAPAEAPTPPTEAPPVAEPTRKATVLEVLDAAERYTFARMDACGAEAWVAGPKVEMTVGQHVEMKGGQGMTDFRSDALDRTFDQLLMVDAWRAVEEAPSCTPAPPAEPLRFGRIVELHETPSYSILELEHCGERVWVAGPGRDDLAVGTEVGMPLGDRTTSFHAQSVGRTFDELFLVPWIKKAKALPACP